MTAKVKNYNKNSFKSWKSDQGESYEENISNLRWSIDFQNDKLKNLAKIDEWLTDSKSQLEQENIIIDLIEPK